LRHIWRPTEITNRHTVEIQWLLKQTTAETGLNDRGPLAHEPKTNKKRGSRRAALRKAERDAAEAPANGKQD
jgi:hypothetical protein